MKALVTGAGGFVGQALTAHLRDHDDEVVAVDRANGPDVTDAAAVRDVIGRERPDAVYHLAAVTHIGASWEAPAEVFRINAEGTLNVLSACAAAGVDRVLVVGSADEYGAVRPEDLPLTEGAPLRPLTPYGASKVAAEYLALQAFLGERLPTIRVRAFNHTGRNQSDRFMIPGLARRIAAAERHGRKEIPVGSVEPVRDFTNVEDVVVAYRLLVERGEPGEVYNVCSGVGHSVAEVADHLLGLARFAIELVPDPSLVRPVEVPRLVGDNTRLRQATGWAPAMPFEETLAAILDRWRAEEAERGVKPSAGEARRANLARSRLYLCTPDRPDLAEFVTAVCGAGVDIVQLRDKVLADRALLERAKVAREAAQAAGALFVLNDRPDLALSCGADGVHVGQDDVSAAVARRILGPDALVGLSTHAPEELAASAAEPVDYISAGPVEPTPTKPGRAGTGLDYIRLAAERSPHPFFVTGGVSQTTLPAIAAAGATRFVVVRALTEAPDPAAVAARLRRLIDAGAVAAQGSGVQT